MAVQYAREMGLNVAAVDIDDGKLALAKRLGATVTVNAKSTDPVSYLKKEIGGAHGVLVTAVSPIAFEQGSAWSDGAAPSRSMDYRLAAFRCRSSTWC